MVDVTWLRWRAWYELQVREEQDNPDDCIPCVVCDCPPRGSEDN